jgi:hypothetical protein
MAAMCTTMRWSLTAGFVVGLLSSPRAVADESPIRTSLRPTVRADVSRELEQALGQKTEVKFADTPLGDALKFLSKAHGINIVVDLVALQQAGVTSKVPVSMEVSGVTLRSALKTMLPEGLVAVVQGEVLKITTPQRAQPAAAVPAKPRPTYFPAPSANEARILATLSEATQLDFNETPLGDALEFLRDFHQIPVYLDRHALQDIGVDPAVPVSVAVSDVSLRSALKLLTEPLGLTVVVEHEVLKVTTRESAGQKIRVRVYPVGDLIASDDDLQVLQAAIRAGTTGVWEADEGGLSGAMSVVPRSATIVIRQTTFVHDEIVELLANLRSAQALAEEQEAPAKPEVIRPQSSPLGF